MDIYMYKWICAKMFKVRLYKIICASLNSAVAFRSVTCSLSCIKWYLGEQVHQDYNLVGKVKGTVML